MAFKMKGKSPMTKALVGKQHNLPPELKAKIEAAPESPMKKYASDAQRKAVHASKAESPMKDRGDRIKAKKELAWKAMETCSIGGQNIKDTFEIKHTIL